MREKDAGHAAFARRHFLETAGCTAMAVAALGGTVLTWEFLSPNVLFEPPSRFGVGPPSRYPPGSVTLLSKPKIFVVREPAGYFLALSAVCTHLGCITAWKATEGIVACPCHGSRFARTGEVLAGPAPRPLRRILIGLEDGQLVVDQSVTVGEDQVLKV